MIANQLTSGEEVKRIIATLHPVLAVGGTISVAERRHGNFSNGQRGTVRYRAQITPRRSSLRRVQEKNVQENCE
jgi:hypothetical protein